MHQEKVLCIENPLLCEKQYTCQHLRVIGRPIEEKNVYGSTHNLKNILAAELSADLKFPKEVLAETSWQHTFLRHNQNRCNLQFVAV